jgi:hypothetical protein
VTIEDGIHELVIQGRADPLQLRQPGERQADRLERRQESAGPEASPVCEEGRSHLLLPHGDEKSVVGIAKALDDAYPDPKDKTGKQSVVDVAPVKKLAQPVTLASIKADAAFKSFPLVRISRLSVMPVTDDEWDAIIAKSSR